VATNQRVSVEMLRQGEWSPAPLLLSLAAAALVLLSAFGVIYSSHACRELYAQLQDLEAGQWHLQEDYSRLLLEESTWASHHRVEKVATAELAMQPPAVENLQVVTQ
jgi:cell division protein FtsL